jgi:hypothetical protein
VWWMVDGRLRIGYFWDWLAGDMLDAGPVFQKMSKALRACKDMWRAGGRGEK